MHNSTKNKKGHVHALIFLTIVCCIFLSATAGITYMILKSTDKELELQVERNLLSKAHGKVSELSTWYGTITNQVGILASSDFLRLFTYEAIENFSNYTEMLELSQNQSDDDKDFIQQPILDEITVYNEGEFPEIIDNTDEDDRIKLALQLASINTNLKNFVEKSNFSSAYIFCTDYKLFASYNGEVPTLSGIQKNILAQANEKNSFIISNAYLSKDNRLTADMVQPILLPEYLSEGKLKTIGYLLISLDVTSAFNRIVSTESQNGISYWIIQRIGNKLLMLSDREQPSALSSKWKINLRNQISFGIRSLDPTKVSLLTTGKTSKLLHLFNITKIDDSKVGYSLGLRVPKLPWLIVADIPVSVAKSTLYSSSNLTLLTIGISILMILLLITFSWWWLVGQKERKSNFQIVSLYDTIEKQKTLLENVNSNLQDGIIMKDKKGTILYANDAFAAMMQESTEKIIGSDFKDIFIGRTNMPINPYIDEVMRTGNPVTYTEMIEIKKIIHHFQVTYAPYKAKDDEIDGIVGIYIDITDLILTRNRHQLMSSHLITVLQRMIEAFDPYLKGHSTYTSQLAVVLAYMHDLSETQVSVIKTAAYLSQIGMIQLPYELRSKTSIFSAEERLLMETHIELAKNILNNIEFGLPVQNVIYQIHEKLDGTGYPMHLNTNEICVESRILAIANTFCAIMRPRAHRKAQGFENALKILSTQNKEYDTNIILLLHAWLKEPEGKNFVKRLETV